VQEDEHDEFIVGTEAGILHQMRRLVPHKTLIPVPSNENNTCACSECAFMKLNTMQKLHDCLLHEKPEIHLDEEVGKKALVPILKMMELS
jgi:quinolinate synthase